MGPKSAVSSALPPPQPPPPRAVAEAVAATHPVAAADGRRHFGPLPRHQEAEAEPVAVAHPVAAVDGRHRLLRKPWRWRQEAERPVAAPAPVEEVPVRNVPPCERTHDACWAGGEGVGVMRTW